MSLAPETHRLAVRRNVGVFWHLRGLPPVGDHFGGPQIRRRPKMRQSVVLRAGAQPQVARRLRWTATARPRPTFTPQGLLCQDPRLGFSGRCGQDDRRLRPGCRGGQGPLPELPLWHLQLSRSEGRIQHHFLLLELRLLRQRLPGGASDKVEQMGANRSSSTVPARVISDPSARASRMAVWPAFRVTTSRAMTGATRAVDKVGTLVRPRKDRGTFRRPASVGQLSCDGGLPRAPAMVSLRAA